MKKIEVGKKSYSPSALHVSSYWFTLLAHADMDHKSPDTDQKTVVLNCVKMQGKRR